MGGGGGGGGGANGKNWPWNGKKMLLGGSREDQYARTAPEKFRLL